MNAATVFHRILVGVDTQELATDAIQRAVELAERLGSGVRLVHAAQVPGPMWPGLTAGELEALHAETLVRARAQLTQELAPRLTELGFDGARFEDALTVRPGPPGKVLLDQAREWNAELIVLGPHAKRSMLDFGSTARTVLARAECPVWNQVGPVHEVSRILVPVDFSEHSRRAVEVASRLAQRLEASLHVVHCYTPPEFAYATSPEVVPGPTYAIEADRRGAEQELQRWMTELEQGPVAADARLIDGHAASALQLEAEQHDLVVMGTHGRTGLSRFLLGSVAYATLKHSPKPVLVVPGQAGPWLLDEG